MIGAVISFLMTISIACIAIVIFVAIAIIESAKREKPKRRSYPGDNVTFSSKRINSLENKLKKVDQELNNLINNAPYFDEEEAVYSDYLKSDKWKYIRDYVLRRDGNQCTRCGAIGTEVHHLSYDNIFHEEWDKCKDLITLCKDCHDREHHIL